MRCNLWDLVDEGIDDVLDRLKGEAGITGISVPLVCPPVEQLRPHKGVSPRTFRSQGGAQFQPRAEFYANTRLKPVVAEWLKKSNPLPAVAEACAKRGLSLRGEIDCCQSPVLIEKYPFAAAKDVFGETNPNWLCPVNPDVAEFLIAQAIELGSMAILNSMEIQHFQFPYERFHRFFLPNPTADTAADESELPRNRLNLNESEEQTPLSGLVSKLRQDLDRARTRVDHLIHENVVGWLLSLCFCESCRQCAGRESIALAEFEKAVLKCLETSFYSGEPPDDSITQLIAANDHLEKFLQWRDRRIEDSIKEMKQRVQLPLLMHRRVDNAGRDDDVQLARHMNGLVITMFKLSRSGSVERSLRVAQRRFGDTLPLHVKFTTAGFAGPKDSTELVRGVSEAAQDQVVEIVFDNYGGTPLSRLAWIKQAVRKALRDVE